MRRRMTASLVPVLVTLCVGTADAQTVHPLRIVQDTEYVEVGADVGVLNLDGWGLWGAHVTRNHTDWLAGEVAVHGSREQGKRYLPVPGYAMFVADARLGGRASDGRGGDLMYFGTVGLAGAAGLSYRYSPMVGFGMQSVVRPGDGGWRFDVQRFPRGHEQYGGFRAMVGLVIAP